MENPIFGKVIRVGTSEAIVVPKQIREALKIERGDRVMFGVYSGDGFFVKKLSTEELRAMRPIEVKLE